MAQASIEHSNIAQSEHDYFTTEKTARLSLTPYPQIRIILG